MDKLIFPHLTPFSLPACPGQDRTIELQDGGKVVARQDGTLVRFDAAGNGVALGDGMTLAGKDGTQYMVKNDALWKQVAGKRGLHPKG